MTYAVTYTLRFNDYLAIVQAHEASGRFGRHARWVRYAVFVSIYLTIIGIFHGTSLHDSQSFGLVILGAVALVVLCLLLDFLFGHIVYRWRFGRFAMANAEVAISLNAEGIHVSAPSRSGTVRWSGVRRIMTTPDYIFLFLSKIEVIALPRRAFATETVFNEAAYYCAQAQADTVTRIS